MRHARLFEGRGDGPDLAGLAGRLYWLAVLPFHGFIFSGMANRITATAEAPEPS